ncbi:MAG: DNA polymerase III subunit beta [candidate division Zixibacteria bacterium]|nr:DNA polymerase III subunit beta [candidate division Zixibacteria bacterium]MDH3936611.1 DNA polymerase III subunit beta [candidate division Zixibacteria bacterium]MDH4032580.1 DNA polymerase III subunit beta [candidate division Zixibacteria bacterium]
MKFSLPKSKLTNYLQHILQVVPSKSTLPILTNVLIEALENKLKISATDLDVSITASLECKVSRKGSASIPAKILFDIVKEVPESEIVFETTGSRMEIKIPNGSYKIATVAAEDFPKLPAVNTKKEIKIEGAGLVKMIRKVSFACSDDETRPALNGVLWQTQSERMQMVATDGHRLARMSIENTKLRGINEDVIIPPKVLNLIPKFLENETREIGIIFGENNIIFNLGDIILTSRLIEGPYPNFEQVIPTVNDKKLVVSKDELAGAVRRVSILSNVLTHQVRFSVKSGRLTLSTTNADVGGEGIEELDCEYNGENIEMGYNATYVTEILGKMEGEEVIFELSTPVAAGVIYAPSIPRNDYLCLVMPLRLAE